MNWPEGVKWRKFCGKKRSSIGTNERLNYIHLMGFKVPKDTPPMERELIYLLVDLCVKWGFCLPPDDFDRITQMEYYNAQDFALDVVKAEGMEGYSSWMSKIAERFRERFGTDEIDVETFIDRIRGVKESW